MNAGYCAKPVGQGPELIPVPTIGLDRVWLAGLVPVPTYILDVVGLAVLVRL